MKRILQKSLFFSLALSTFLMVIISGAFAQASLSGRVIDDSTQKALSDVEVQIGELDITATTDAEGHYDFENLEPGTHTISVSADGYQHWSRDIEIGEEPKELVIRLMKKEPEQEITPIGITPHLLGIIQNSR